MHLKYPYTYVHVHKCTFCSSSWLDADDFDTMVLEDELCGCPNPKVHTRQCPKNARNRGKKLFPKHKLGDTVCIHISNRPQKHLLCKIAQEHTGRFTLVCQKGRLAERFGASELYPVESDYPIPLQSWRQSQEISTKYIPEDDMVHCFCPMDEANYIVISEEDDAENVTAIVTAIATPLYKLSSDDMATVEQPTGWLNDNIVKASQDLLAQQFPNIKGLQAPTLQQVTFRVHTKEFVQIINVNNCHWCVVSTVKCPRGQVNVYDTLFESVQESSIPVIASLLNCPLSDLTIRMMPVQKQTNASDCGILAVAMSLDLCSGNDPCISEYGNTQAIREHLKNSLETCKMTRFPVVTKERKATPTDFKIPLFCYCRMPEDSNIENPYVGCSKCSQWFHKVCASVPDNIFDDNTLNWYCKECTKQTIT